MSASSSSTSGRDPADAADAPGAMPRGKRKSGEPLFGPDFLKILERLELIARQIIQGRRQAMRPSAKKGASIEFKDFREYSPGDDPRTVDWLVYGRLGELYVRLFRQEEELDLWLLVDRSASMEFGPAGSSSGPSKYDHARRIAAALAYVGMSCLDSASVMPFDADLTRGLEKMRGKGQVFRLMKYLEELETGSGTDLVRAVQRFTARVRRPGLVVVLSDFYGLREARAALDRLRFLKHQVHVVQVISPWENDPPLRGELRLVDSETGAHQNLTITDSMLKRYKQAYAGLGKDLRSYAMSHAVGYEQADTSVAFDEFVRKMLQRPGAGGLLA